MMVLAVRNAVLIHSCSGRAAESLHNVMHNVELEGVSCHVVVALHFLAALFQH